VISKRNIALVGFMAAGKTSIGLVLSRRTGLPFADVDRIIEEKAGRTIADLFAADGEPRFREIEGNVFRALCAGTGRIIGCGGGTLLDPRNRAAMVEGCFAIWLRVSPEEVLARISLPDAPIRPLVEGASPNLIVPRLMQAREVLYSGADLVIDTERKGVDEIAEEIRLSLGLPLLENR
jgi:shikimate kinase